MKKLFSLLTLALLTMSAWAQTTVTIDLTAQGYANQDEVTTITSGDVTVTFDKGGSSTTPKWYDNGSAVRVYAKNTITVTTAGQDPITGVTFTYGGSDGSNPITSNVGTFDSPNWTGSASEVVFTIGGTSGNRRFVQIDVTLGGEVVETITAPEFSPADGAQFDDSLAITLTCTTADAIISYSTDGVTWQTYTEPFTITETTTVYAKSAKGNLVSEVVSATYTKREPVSGTCIVFNYADDEAFTTAQEYTVTRPGVSFTVTNGMINGHYRIYKGQTITFTSTIGNIIRIEFDGVSGNPVSNFGTVEGMTYDGINGVWTGEATTVTFTAVTAQVRCTEIRVYVDGEAPVVIAAPTIPASQNFEESITVEITNNEDGATVMYTTDGTNWTPYTQVLTFTETTTLQAKAVKGEDESVVVSATYTKVEPQEDITTLAQVNALANNTEFEFKGDAVVTVQRGSYLWLRDASGYGLIYGNINGASDVTFAPGTVLSQNWTAKTKIFSGLMEYVESANVTASGNTNAALAAIQEITALDTTMVNAYVEVKNVKSFAVDNKNVTATLSDGTTMVMYNTFSESIPTTEGNYTVEGVVSTHNGLQLIILGVEGYVPETYDVNDIAEALALADNSTFTMYNDVVVTYQNGNRLWIRDTENNSGLIYGALEATFNNGDVLSDGWTAKKTVYNNVPEFVEPQDIAASGDTRDAAPFEVTTFTNDNVNDYVILKGITVLTDSTNAKRYYNAADSTVLFNTFNLELPEVVEGKTYDVTGIVTIYYNNPQLYITEMTEVAEEFLRGDVNQDQIVNISDVTALINILLTNSAAPAAADCNQDTLVNISDVTSLINYLLTGRWGN